MAARAQQAPILNLKITLKTFFSHSLFLSVSHSLSLLTSAQDKSLQLASHTSRMAGLYSPTKFNVYICGYGPIRPARPLFSYTF